MLEQVYRYTVTQEKTLERAVQEDHFHIVHMVLPKGEGFPEHEANAAVYMTVISGRLSITLGDQQPHTYGRGDILKIPRGTRMKGENRQDGVVELIVAKLFDS